MERGAKGGRSDTPCLYSRGHGCLAIDCGVASPETRGGLLMTQMTDFVIAGGGHNSLITAAYLARAGYEVIVLDARPEVGGGAATEEILLPGFGFDTCSTGHTLIQVNPLLTRDELGLLSEYGLEYVYPDPVAHVVFPDGEHYT